MNRVVVLLCAMSAWAQAPVINARVERVTARSLAADVQAVAERGVAAWVGYRVPIAPRSRPRLEFTGSRAQCRLEPPTELVVLARVEAKSLVELRPVGVDCDIDAAGMPLVWLDGVTSEQSVGWLASMVADAVAGRGSERLLDPALMAIGLHEGPAASRTLVAAAREGKTARVRGQALVWLAQRATDRAGATIAEAVERDPEVEVKKRAVFALSQLSRDEGIPLLIDVARRHRIPEVRRQAMVFLGQSHDPRAIDFFEQVLLK